MQQTSPRRRTVALVGATAVLATAAASALAPAPAATAAAGTVSAGAESARTSLATSQTTSQAAAPAKAKAKPTGYARVDDVDVFLADVPGTVTGRVGAPRVRRVKLEARKGAGWSTVATTKTRKDGSFTFSRVKLRSTTQVRVNAPAASFIGSRTAAEVKKVAAQKAAAAKRAKKAWKKAKRALADARKSGNKSRIKKARKKYTAAAGKKLRTAGAARNAARQARKKPYVAPWSVSPAVTLTVAGKQSVGVAMLPEIAQQGTSAAAPRNGTIASVRTYPGRGGRKVTLQVERSGSWSTVRTAQTDVLGNAVFPVEVGGRYRAKVEAKQGFPAGTTAARTAPKFTPDWEDTFSGVALDPAKWSSADRGLGNGLRSCAVSGDRALTVSGGVLRMGVKKDPSRAGQTCVFKDGKGTHRLPYMVNTQIDTSKNYTFTHGIAAARVKVQSAVGMHSGFWSHPTTSLVRNNPAKGTEIDVMEYFGDDYHEKGIGAFVHHDVNGTVVKEGRVFQKTPSLLSTSSTRMSQKYAVYSVEWTPTAYVFRLDGREFHRQTRHVSQVPQFLALSLLTSSWELMNLKDFGSTADVDWVRVWER